MNKGELNKQTVRDFFFLLEQGNAEGVSQLFSEQAIHLNPYGSGLFQERVVGKENIKNYWEAPINNFEGMSFPIDEIYAMEDENIVFVKYTGKVVLKDNAGLYENDYYSTFKFNEDGKITEYVEIFNPIVAARGFGLLDQIK